MALLMVDVAAIVLLIVGMGALRLAGRNRQATFHHYNSWVRLAIAIFAAGAVFFTTNGGRWRRDGQTTESAQYAFGLRLGVSMIVTLLLLLLLRRITARVHADDEEMQILEGTELRQTVPWVEVHRIRRTEHYRDGSPRWWTRNSTLDEGLFVLERTDGSVVFLPRVNNNGAMFRFLKRKITAAAPQREALAARPQPKVADQWTGAPGGSWGLPNK